MLATIPDNTEVDLSHLSSQVAYAISPDAPQTTNESLRYLVIGVIASCAIHALVLLVNWGHGVTALKNSESTTLRIQLQTPPTPEPLFEQLRAPEPVETDTAKVVPDTTPVPHQQTFPLSAQPDEIIQQPEMPKNQTLVLESLNADELRDIIRTNNTNNRTTHASGIAANVFNPALRQRLLEEGHKPKRQVDNGLTTHTDAANATLVAVDEGECLRSSLAEVGEAQNWYMTSCGGTSESEQIMERVNQAVNGKLRFEE